LAYLALIYASALIKNKELESGNLQNTDRSTDNAWPVDSLNPYTEWPRSRFTVPQKRCGRTWLR